MFCSAFICNPNYAIEVAITHDTMTMFAALLLLLKNELQNAVNELVLQTVSKYIPLLPKKKIRVFLCRRTVRVKVKGKIIPTNSLKIKGKRPFVGAEERRKGKGQQNWWVIRAQVLKHLP